MWTSTWYMWKSIRCYCAHKGRMTTVLLWYLPYRYQQSAWFYESSTMPYCCLEYLLFYDLLVSLFALFATSAAVSNFDRTTYLVIQRDCRTTENSIVMSGIYLLFSTNCSNKKRRMRNKNRVTETLRINATISDSKDISQTMKSLHTAQFPILHSVSKYDRFDACATA